MKNNDLEKWYQVESSKIKSRVEKLAEIKEQLNIAYENEDLDKIEQLNKEFKKLIKGEM